MTTMEPVGPTVGQLWGMGNPGDYICSMTPYQYHAEFNVYEVVAVDCATGNMEFDKGDDPGGNPSLTANMKEAKPYFSGSVKWDGCCNVSFIDDGAALHFCGRKHLARMTTMVLRVFDFAAELIPTFDREVAL
jgi:hypothetical protein